MSTIHVAMTVRCANTRCANKLTHEFNYPTDQKHAYTNASALKARAKKEGWRWAGIAEHYCPEHNKKTAGAKPAKVTEAKVKMKGKVTGPSVSKRVNENLALIKKMAADRKAKQAPRHAPPEDPTPSLTDILPSE